MNILLNRIILILLFSFSYLVQLEVVNNENNQINIHEKVENFFQSNHTNNWAVLVINIQFSIQIAILNTTK